MNTQDPEQLQQYIEEDTDRFERILLPAYLYNKELVGSIEQSLGRDRAGEEVEDFARATHTALFFTIREYHQLTSYGFFQPPSIPTLTEVMTKLCYEEAGKLAITEEMIGPTIQDLLVMCDSYIKAFDYCNDLVRRGMFYWLEHRRLQTTIQKTKSLRWTSSKFSEEWAQEQAHVRLLAGAGGVKKLWYSARDCIDVPPVPVFLTTPWPDLNERIGGGLARGDASLIVGAVAAGKTIVACQLAADMAIRQQAKGILITTEQSGPAIMPRIVSNCASVPYKDLVGNRSVQMQDVSPALHGEVETVLAKLESSQFHFRAWEAGDNIHTGIQQIVQHYKERISTDGRLDFLIMDWIGGAITSGYRDEEEKRAKLQFAADTMARLAEELDIVTFATAQANRTQSANKAAIGAPQLADCKSLDRYYANTFGISALFDAEMDPDSHSVQPRFKLDQFINIDKGRFGSGGLIPVRRDYGFQRLQANYKHK